MARPGPGTRPGKAAEARSSIRRVVGSMKVLLSHGWWAMVSYGRLWQAVVRGMFVVALMG